MQESLLLSGALSLLLAVGGLLLVWSGLFPSWKVTLFCRRVVDGEVDSGGLPLVYLVGTSGSGKTCVMKCLLEDKFIPTMSSVTISSVVYPLSTDQKVVLVDIPGHRLSRSRLEGSVKDNILKSHVIIFVVDAPSKTMTMSGAELLYTLLKMLCVASKSIPILVLLNKSDLKSLRPHEVVKENLEREIDRLRRIQVDEDEECTQKQRLLGLPETDFFRFSKYTAAKLEVVSGSAKLPLMGQHPHPVAQFLSKYITSTVTPS